MIDYCMNCDNEAVYQYNNESGTFQLCGTCEAAFELGQVNPEAEIYLINQEDEEDE